MGEDFLEEVTADPRSKVWSGVPNTTLRSREVREGVDEAFRFKYKAGRQRDGEVSRAMLNRLRSSAEGSGEPGRGAMQRNDIIRATSRKINCLECE